MEGWCPATAVLTTSAPTHTVLAGRWKPTHDTWPPMRALQNFERRLEGAVEGFFARAFRSGLQPIELAKAVQRYAEDHQHVTTDGVVVPNVYRIEVAPKDRDRLSSFGESLPRELGEVVVMTASDRGWQLRGPVKVSIGASDDVRVGRYTLAGRVEVVDPRANAAPYPSQRPAAARAPNGADVDGIPARADGAEHDGAEHDGTAHGGSRSFTDDAERFDRTQVVTEAPRSGYAVRLTGGPNAGQVVPVSGQRMTFGRLSTCAITVAEPSVSREHAALVRRGDRWWIIDLGSTNGTRVNGVRAAEQPIGAGDRIQLGDAVVEFLGG